METPQVILASYNSGKLREIRKILAPLGTNITSPAAFSIPEPEETGLSFVENAILKARHAAYHTGLAALADDSGLEVDALNGQPGIYSARYAGAASSDQKNLEKLLAQLKGIPTEERSARYQCLAVYLRHWHDPTPLICQGTWEGRISTSPRGTQGFGYDPIFYLPDQHCTAAELLPEEKHCLSHRGKALRCLLAALKPVFSGK